MMAKLPGSLVLVAGLLGAPLATAQGVVVTVLNEHGQPVEGVAGQVGDLLATSGSDGLIFFLGLEPGTYQMTMRIPGYHPDLRNVEVTAGPPVRLTVRLNSAARAQRPVISEGVSPGLRGLVTNPAMRPIAGAEVHLFGRRGAVLSTDSAGGFHARDAEGTYMVRVVAPGFRESRFSVAISGGDAGMEALVPLLPADASYTGTSNAEQLLLRQLGRRLGATRPQPHLHREELAAWGFRSLCEVPEVAARRRRMSGAVLSGWENGERVINVCTMRANEAELVEIGNRIIVWTPR